MEVNTESFTDPTILMFAAIFVGIWLFIDAMKRNHKNWKELNGDGSIPQLPPDRGNQPKQGKKQQSRGGGKGNNRQGKKQNNQKKGGQRHQSNKKSKKRGK